MRNWKLVAGLIAAVAVSVPAYAQKAVSPQDYAEIMNLYNRYAWSIDTRAENGMVYAKTFTPDGEFVNGNNKTVGREKLAEMIRGNGQPSPIPTHYTTNIVIESSP